MTDKKIVCLFGSGISIAAGMPSTRKITLKLLYEPEFWRYSNTRYFSGPRVGGYESAQDRALLVAVRALIRRTHTALTTQLLDSTAPWYNESYEDIAYLLNQMWMDDAVPMLDPAIARYSKSFKESMSPFLLDACVSWQDLIIEARNRIADLVWQELLCHRRPLSYLDNLLGRMLCEIGVGNTTIITTNHDLVLQTYLSEKAFKWNDGFLSDGSGVRFWHPESFDEQPDSIALLKVHGSINWFRPFVNPSGWRGIVSDIDPMATTHPSLGTLSATRPLILIGTHNKSDDYTSEPYSELQYRAHAKIMNCQVVLVCGYGFADRGVNQSS